MSGKTITIEEVQKSEAAWQRVIRFGAKALQTPAQIVLIEKESDLTPIVESHDMESIPQGLAASLAELSLLPPAAQTALPGFELGAHEYDSVRGNVPVFFDPDTDLFYNGRAEDRVTFAARPQLPAELRAAIPKLKSDTYNTWWVRMHNEGKILPMLIATVRMQVAGGADAILPFAPYLDGQTQATAEIALAANAQTRTLVASMAPGREAYYYNLAPKAFLNTAVTSKLLTSWENDITAGTMPALLVLKITNPNGNDAVTNHRIRNFFERLNELKELASIAGTPFAIGLIAPTGRGVAMVFAGIDFFVESFGPPGGFARGQTGVAPPSHGRYYHPAPGFYDFVSFDELQELFEANGRALPCPCAACERYAGVGLPINDDTEWNAARRVHFVNARRREIEMFLRAIRDGNARDAMDWVGRGNNAHYSAWLPKRYV